jgi:hypothetical protein
MADSKSTTIATAAAATTQTEEAIGRIERALRAPRFINGFGIYADRSMAAANLGAARFAVEAAFTAIRSCPWPTTADYDAEG